MALVNTLIHDTLSSAERQIRLLKIEGRVSSEDGNDGICCSLQAFTFENAPEYTALSYAWGPPDPCLDITVNGKVFSVRLNLFDFLHQISQTGEGSDSMFWIDQICIDQRSLEERCSQVSFMDEIYKRALLTIVWLGPGEGPSPDMRKDFFWWILNNSYWSRLWIVQEVCLSAQVLLMYGSESMSWAEFEGGWTSYNVEAFKTPVWTGRDRFNHLRNLRLNFQNGFTVKRSLVEMVSGFYQEYTCTQPHDHVYAVLSLLPPDQRVLADYAISLDSLNRKLIENAWCYRSQMGWSTRDFIVEIVRKLSTEELEKLSGDLRDSCEQMRRMWNESDRKAHFLDQNSRGEFALSFFSRQY